MNQKQALAVTATSVLAAGMAKGSVVYSGVVSNVLSGTASYQVDLDQDGTTDYTVHFDGSSGNQLKPFVDARSTPNPNAWILSNANGGSPLTTFGTSIDDNYAATFPTNKVGYLYEQYNGNTVVGDWPSTANTDGYVGLELNTGTSTNYGWIHLVYNAADPNNKTLVVMDYGYETVPNVPIPAGAQLETAAPHIYYEPQSQTNAAGTPAQLTVVALANPAPAYQWKAGPVGSGIYTNLVDDGNITGSTSATLSIASATQANALDYIVVVTNVLGAATSSPPATLTILKAKVSNPTPSPEQIFAGQMGHFSVQLLAGDSPAFQWRKNGSNLSDGGTIVGSASSNLVITAVAGSDAGNYDCIVTTSYGSVTSSFAPLIVLSTNGGAFQASVLADSPVSYYPLNELTDPSTNNTIAFDDVGGNNGIYGVTVQNGFSNVTGPGPADGFSGFSSANAAGAFTVNDPNSYIKLAPWNLNTNTVTITAWINPQANQVSGAGVVYTRSTNSMVCGLAYHGAANSSGEYSLGYNWNDQIFAWNWTSGLIVPQNMWSFVAVVVTPTNATVYVINTNSANSAVNVMSAVNVATHVPQSFNDVVYIGRDPAGVNGERNFAGKIDEVAVYNKSLTVDQLEQQFAAALNLVGLPPGIISEPTPQVIYAGQTAHLQVGTVGSQPLTYQWMGGSNGSYTNLVDGGNISGATTATLAIHNISAANAGNYYVVVTNASGSRTSIVVPVTIQPLSGNGYEAGVLSVGGLAAYYPLNETGDPATNNVIAFDYAGGFNGIYGNAAENGNGNYNVAGPRPSDGFPGFSPTNTAALTSPQLGPTSEIVCSPMNLDTNALTITAWINPSSLPDSFTGLVFCRGGDTVAGLDFTQTNAAVGGGASLGYHWNNSFDTYTWSSGLYVPVAQWSFVALVVDPSTTNATIWLLNTSGAQSASNFTVNNLAVQSFSTGFTIGNDDADPSASRIFDGAICQVAIYSQALPPDQIQSLYNRAIGIVPVDLQAHFVGGNVQITWGTGTLLEASSVNGPWTTNTASSPYLVVPSAPQKFYRVKTP